MTLWRRNFQHDLEMNCQPRSRSLADGASMSWRLSDLPSERRVTRVACHVSDHGSCETDGFG